MHNIGMLEMYKAIAVGMAGAEIMQANFFFTNVFAPGSAIYLIRV